MLLFSPVLSVTSVRVEGVSPEESGAVHEAAGVSHGTPMALLDTTDVAARVRRVAFVREASAAREWPQSVVVHVVPRTALLAARTADRQVRLVDEAERHLRALLRDVLCGYLDQDLRALSDELLLEQQRPAPAPEPASVPATPVAAEPEPEPEVVVRRATEIEQLDWDDAGYSAPV